MQVTMETNVTHLAATGSVPAPSPTKPPALKIIGIGNAGVNLVEDLRRSGWESASFAVVSADREALASSSAAEKIHLEPGSAAGSGGRGGERGSRSPDNAWPKLKTLCGDVQTALVIAGLGGRTGTSISLAAVKAAKQAGALTLAFVTLPFKCEGSLRQQQAQTGLAQIRAVADVVFCLPNQKTLPLIQEETNLVDTFKISNQLLTDCLRSVCQALTTNSVVMGLPFSDLCALVQEQQGATAFAVAEAAGTNRACEVVEKLLKHPLVEGGRILPEAGTILVSVVGGPDLTMAEVNRVMEKISGQCQGAPVVMGAGVHSSSKGKLVVVLMVTGAGEAVKPGDLPGGNSQASSVAVSQGAVPELDTQLLSSTAGGRPGSRFVPPPPVLSPEQREQIIAQHAGAGAGQRKNAPRLRQAQLPLGIVSKGRFDKSEPTIHKGEDLDVPTFIRRGVALN